MHTHTHTRMQPNSTRKDRDDINAAWAFKISMKGAHELIVVVVVVVFLPFDSAFDKLEQSAAFEQGRNVAGTAD